MRIDVREIKSSDAYSFLRENKTKGVSTSPSKCAERFFGAFMQNECVGIAGYFEKSGRIRIKGLLVKEKYRKNGIMTTLLQEIEKETEKYSYKDAYCTEDSIRLFMLNGYSVCGENKFGYKHLRKIE